MENSLTADEIAFLKKEKATLDRLRTQLRFPSMLRKMWSGSEVSEWLKVQIELAESEGGETHSDNMVVDRFSRKMKDKLMTARMKGRSGWDDPEQCSGQVLIDLLAGHIQKDNAGNWIDLANLCMMLEERGIPETSLLNPTE